LNKHKPDLDRPLTKREREKIETMCRDWWRRMVMAWNKKCNEVSWRRSPDYRLTPEEKEW